jgi:UDP-2,3-diacylglucosamine hydrolase
MTTLFLQLLKNRANKAAQLYILGDFFDAWIGDDDDTPLIHECTQALKACSNNTELFLMHGNRDFLMGEQFAQNAGMTLLSDSHIISFLKTKALIMHGDQLCTDDVKYQQARTMVRSPQWQQQFLSQDLATRRVQAEQYRQASGEHQSMQAADIIDVNQDAVEQAMLDANVTTLIHGHTHRPAAHQFQLQQQSATRYVLAPWETDTGFFLSWTAKGFRSEQLT